jgi:hypothetical protein
MMKSARTSETLVNFYQTTWHYNPEDSHFLRMGDVTVLNLLGVEGRHKISKYIMGIEPQTSQIQSKTGNHYKWIADNAIPCNIQRTGRFLYN